MAVEENFQMIDVVDKKSGLVVGGIENDKLEDPEQLGLFAAMPIDAVSTAITMNPEPTKITDAQMSDIHAEELPTLPDADNPHAAMPEGDDAQAQIASFGQRLRAAREARGWSREEVASRLRLPTQIIQSLEAESYERIQHSIYLRGYLKNYTRLLDIPQITIDKVLREHGQTPELVSTGKISRSRYLFDRYSVSALYLILTGVIIVPAVMLAMRTTFEPNLAQFKALDTLLAPGSVSGDPGTNTVNALAIPPESGNTTNVPTSTAQSPAVAETTNAHSPLIASMAPFGAGAQTSDADPHASAPVTSTPISIGGKHTLKLSLRAASWVEIVGADGEKLEYGLLPAGTQRTYASDKVLEVRLGNGTGAEIEVDGKRQDLSPYQRANVAHFKLFAQDQLISRTDT